MIRIGQWDGGRLRARSRVPHGTRGRREGILEGKDGSSNESEEARGDLDRRGARLLLDGGERDMVSVATRAGGGVARRGTYSGRGGGGSS